MKIIYFFWKLLQLKVAKLIEAFSYIVNELMMLNEYQSQGHSLTLVKGHSDFKVKTCFSHKQSDDLKPKFI